MHEPQYVYFSAGLTICTSSVRTRHTLPSANREKNMFATVNYSSCGGLPEWYRKLPVPIRRYSSVIHTGSSNQASTTLNVLGTGPSELTSGAAGWTLGVSKADDLSSMPLVSLAVGVWRLPLFVCLLWNLFLSFEVKDPNAG